AGGLEMITHDQGVIPRTTTTTMAIKTGDLTGNGMRELYFAQIAGRSTGISETLKMQDLGLYCADISDAAAREVCTRNMEIKTWYRSGNSFDPAYAGKCPTLTPRDAAECRAMLVKDLAIQRRDASICALIPADQPIPRAYCDLHFLPTRQPTAAEIELTHPQILRSNVLLELEGAAYTDSAEARGLDVGGWSWDTKLRDFDLDGDTDVYIVNGTWVPNEVSPSNLYFENDGAGNFTETSGPAGLEDYLMTAAASAFDADGDGDMDMVTHPVNGPLVFFENTSQAPRLMVSLEDTTGNRAGIGAQVTLIDDTGHAQLREIQSGGGFMSFDAPQLSFGLAEGRRAAALEIRWPDGTLSHIEEGLIMGQHLHVTRL
ncbi:MAG: ASPIC/UnbV domain-containing protein, partial [Pseudomonadota bacterium]